MSEGFALLLVTASDPAPEANDVVAGWTAFGLFILGLVAVAALGVSLTRRLRNVDAAEEQGLYDPPSPRGQRQRDEKAAGRGLRSARLPQDGEPPAPTPTSETP